MGGGGLGLWISGQTPQARIAKPVVVLPTGKVLVLFPDGEEEVVWADFDTRSDADVINTHEATRWRNKHKIPWGESGGSYRVMGGGTVVPQGSLQVTGEVSSRNVSNRIPRRLRLDLQCEIMEAPAPLVLGLPTLQSTGLLAAILSQPGEAELPDLEDSDGVDDWGADIPEEVVRRAHIHTKTSLCYRYHSNPKNCRCGCFPHVQCRYINIKPRMEKYLVVENFLWRLGIAHFGGCCT